MMKKHMNAMKLAVVAMMFVTSFLTLANTEAQKVATPKSINWGNAIKATILSGTSVAGVYAYYKLIIEPYVIILAKYKGLDYAIKFNKDFIINNPGLAALNATPLFLAILHAVLARDYVQKIWNKVEDTE